MSALARVAILTLAPWLCDGVSLRRRTGQRSISLSQLRHLEFSLINEVKENHTGVGQSGSDEVDTTSTVMKALDSKLESLVGAEASTGAAAGGLSPDAIQGVLDTMKEGILATHNATEDRVQQLIQAFAQCAVDKSSSDAELSMSEQTVTSKNGAHVDCRSTEGSLFSSKETCSTELKGLQATKEATCGAVDAMKQDPGTAADICHSQGEEYGAWLVRNRDYFMDKAEKFKTAEEVCKNATAKVDEKTPLCDGLKKDWADEKAKCDQFQEQLESATCSYGVEASTVCGSLDDCWESAKSAYGTATPQIISQVSSNKAQWRAVMRMVCLLDTFEASEQDAAIDECIAKTHDTSHLDVTIPPPPPKPDCEMGMPLPCDGAYAGLRYSSLPAGAQAAECSPCAITGESNGWELIMKLMTDKFDFDSAYWENDALWNEISSPATEEDAKYSGFVNTPFKDIRMCVGSPAGNCVAHHFVAPWESAKALFSAGYIADPSLDEQAFLNVFDVPPGILKSCPLLSPGFNLKLPQENRARWGFGNNVNSQVCGDGGDADAVIGVGVHGQEDSPPKAAGYTGWFTGVPLNSGKASKVWLWVKASGPPSSAAGSQTVSDGEWSLIMKIAPGQDLGYSSPLWENDELLNPQSPVHDLTMNAKYAAFGSKKFSSIRMCVSSPTNCVTPFTFDKEWANAKELFSAGYLREPGLDQDSILSTFGVADGSYRKCPMQRPGFNIQCKHGNWARIGFCTDCSFTECHTEDSDDSDAAIGVGLQGQKTPMQMGAGWTNYFASGEFACHANSMTFKTVWLWVK